MAGMSKVKAPNPPFIGRAAHVSVGENFPIHRVVIHATVSPCRRGQARATAAYFQSQHAGGSAHYIVDPYEVVQSVGDHHIAQHAPPNQHSIGNELCYIPTRVPVGFWKLPNAIRMLKLAAKLVARECLAFDVPVVRLSTADVRDGKRGICGHVNVSQAFHQSSHWDPGWFPWRYFMRLVRREVKALKEAHR